MILEGRPLQIGDEVEWRHPDSDTWIQAQLERVEEVRQHVYVAPGGWLDVKWRTEEGLLRRRGVLDGVSAELEKAKVAAQALAERNADLEKRHVEITAVRDEAVRTLGQSQAYATALSNRRDMDRANFQALSDRYTALEKERDAYRKAKQENDERYMIECGAARTALEKSQHENRCLESTIDDYRHRSDRLQKEVDKLRADAARPSVLPEALKENADLRARLKKACALARASDARFGRIFKAVVQADETNNLANGTSVPYFIDCLEKGGAE